MAPEVPFYAIETTASTVDAKQPCREMLQVRRDVGTRTIRISGNVPAGTTCKVQMQIEDPAEYAALALKGALERRGVRITGAAVAFHNRYAWPTRGGDAAAERAAQGVFASGKPSEGMVCSGPGGPVARDAKAGAIVLANHTAPRLADDLQLTLKVSQNLHAEIIMRNLGLRLSCNSAETQSHGLAAVRAFLAGAGIAKGDVVLYDGSGLSGHDLTTPRALTQVLVYAAKQTWGETYKAALPVGGVDGTLANRFLPPGSKLAGRVSAKTGTLGESRGLSGYVTTSSGQTLAFSVMVDNHRPGSTADRMVMDKIVEVIAAGN